MSGAGDDRPSTTGPKHGGSAMSDALAAYYAGIVFRPLPPDGFDPSAASDAVLRYHGLPAPADAGPNRAVVAFYQTFLRRRSDGVLRFVSAASLSAPAIPVRVTPLSAPAPWPAQKSVNWSGGYVTPRGGGSLVAVMGTWTVPTVTEPAGGTEPEYHSSTWIGLDGQRAYPDSTLPQIGTRQRWIRGEASPDKYDAWFQWWSRGQPNQPNPLPSFPVEKGDTISAILTVLNPTTVRFNMKNVTQSVMLQAFDVPAPGSRIVSGATAEWIMERPSPIGSDGWAAYPLPAYTPFAFTSCLAQSRVPGASTPVEVGLETARLIRMYRIRANPTRLHTVSVATRVLQPMQLEMSYVAA